MPRSWMLVKTAHHDDCERAVLAWRTEAAWATREVIVPPFLIRATDPPERPPRDRRLRAAFRGEMNPVNKFTYCMEAPEFEMPQLA